MSFQLATRDGRVWGWSVATLLFLGLVVTALVRVSLAARPPRIGMEGAIAIALLLVIFLTFSFAPRSYEINGKMLRIRTVAFSVLSYDLSQLTEARSVNGGDVFSPGTWRVFGVGGLFGYYGVFRNSTLGNFTAFVTNRGNLVLCRFRDRTLVLSPRDSDSFLRHVRSASQGL